MERTIQVGDKYRGRYTGKPSTVMALIPTDEDENGNDAMVVIKYDDSDIPGNQWQVYSAVNIHEHYAYVQPEVIRYGNLYLLRDPRHATSTISQADIVWRDSLEEADRTERDSIASVARLGVIRNNVTTGVVELIVD
jgi:hypothetical protein